MSLTRVISRRTAKRLGEAGYCLRMFIGRALRSAPKPECISATIERA